MIATRPFPLLSTKRMEMLARAVVRLVSHRAATPRRDYTAALLVAIAEGEGFPFLVVPVPQLLDGSEAAAAREEVARHFPVEVM